MWLEKYILVKQDRAIAGISAGVGPDVVQVGGQDTAWLASGVGQPLTRFFNEWALNDQVPPQLIAQNSFRGEVWSVPYLTAPRTIVYHKDIFAEAGLDPSSAPDTWDDVLSATERLVKRNGEEGGRPEGGGLSKSQVQGPLLVCRRQTPGIFFLWNLVGLKGDVLPPEKGAGSVQENTESQPENTSHLGSPPRRPMPADLPNDRLVDSFGRVVRKMRISVTDRCNFRCVYCMPEGDIPWMPKEELLTFEEFERLARIAAQMGVTKLRLTGGEPLVRKDIPVLVDMLRQVPGIQKVGMTTNGFYLPSQAEALQSAGLGGVNISLDTLDREKFIKMTRRDYLHKVLDGIRAAQEAGLKPIKINTVIMRGYNDDEVPDFLRWGIEQGLQVRFIEFMPLNGDGPWSRDLVVPVDELLKKAREVGDFVDKGNDPRDPAREYVFADGGEFGIIPTISRPFCGQCDRIRLTADGKIRNCLFALDEHSLREPLRAGADDDELADAFKKAVWAKWEGHMVNQADFIKPKRAMYAIGG